MNLSITKDITRDIQFEYSLTIPEHGPALLGNAEITDYDYDEGSLVIYYTTSVDVEDFELIELIGQQVDDLGLDFDAYTINTIRQDRYGQFIAVITGTTTIDFDPTESIPLWESARRSLASYGPLTALETDAVVKLLDRVL